MSDNIKFSPEDIEAMAQAVYGEETLDADVQKMIAQTMLSRMRSNRSKEFGADVPEMLRKGYYAVSNQNIPYKEATGGKRKVEIGALKKQIEALIADEDYGDSQFYFTPEEIKKKKEKGSFNFNIVNPRKIIGGYQTYGY